MIGDEKGAIYDYTKVIELKSDDFDSYTNRGVSKMRLGNYEDAIMDFEKAININPEFGLAYLNLGGAYHLIGNKEKACESWEKALYLGKKNCIEPIEMYCNKTEQDSSDYVFFKD